MADILDTSFEGKQVKLTDNKVRVGDEVNITAKDPTLKKILVGCGWDLVSFNTDAVDLDVSMFMIDRKGLTRVDEDFVFYNNREVFEGGVKHNGDSRTGAGDGDDESIYIDLHKVPFDVMKIVFALSIYKGEEKSQSLSMVRNTYLRLVNFDTAHELLRYDLSPDIENRPETTMVVASLNREGPKWHFTPIGEFIESGGLATLAKRYGLIITQQ